MLKALTIHQPYASAIMAGNKLFETRPWHPGKVSEFVLHAGKGTNIAAQSVVKQFIPDWPKVEDLPYGAALGIVTITNVYPVADIVEEIDELELRIGNWDDGYYAWELNVIEIFDKPISIKGQQKFWNWEKAKRRQAKHIKIPVTTLFPTKGGK